MLNKYELLDKYKIIDFSNLEKDCAVTGLTNDGVYFLAQVEDYSKSSITIIEDNQRLVYHKQDLVFFAKFEDFSNSISELTQSKINSQLDKMACWVDIDVEDLPIYTTPHIMGLGYKRERGIIKYER